jgi:hypothetical protein
MATDGFSDQKIETSLFPDLTLLRHIASCLLQQKLWPSRRTTCNQQNDMMCLPSHGGFSSKLNATSLAISK